MEEAAGDSLSCTHIVPGVHRAEVQMVFAGNCRLLGEAPWSMAADLYPC